MNTQNNPVSLNNNINKKISTKDIVMTGMFTAILCVMAPVAIPTPTNIPFSFSLFAIFLIGALLSPSYAFLSVMIYIIIGASGVPVFAGLKGGLQVLTGYTGGYIIAYPIMAFLISFLYKTFKKFKTVALTLGMLLSLVICYCLGTLWFSFASGTGFVAALSLCVLPYVPFDILKIVLAIGASTILRKTALKDF